MERGGGARSRGARAPLPPPTHSSAAAAAGGAGGRPGVRARRRSRACSTPSWGRRRRRRSRRRWAGRSRPTAPRCPRRGAAGRREGLGGLEGLLLEVLGFEGVEEENWGEVEREGRRRAGEGGPGVRQRPLPAAGRSGAGSKAARARNSKGLRSVTMSVSDSSTLYLRRVAAVASRGQRGRSVSGGRAQHAPRRPRCSSPSSPLQTRE